jgi:ribulose-5-phosphate 4-epimerase/fuculose-1-phosphate aldolase
MIAIEPPSLNVTVLEVEDDGCHYRMRLGTPSIQQLNQMRIEAPKPTSEFFHYMLIFDRLGDNGFNALVHLQPKFLNLISRSEHGSPSRFYNFLRGYEPETPIIYDQSGGIGLVMEKAPGIPDLSFESLRLFTGEDLVEDKRSNHRHVIYWIGHGTFSRGNDILDAYRHAEYFESAARMAWEANQKSINAQAYTDDIVSCIMQEFQKNQTTSSSQDSFDHPQENLFNY